jgi:WhiB family redox-sensing transcriptional regulator
MKALAKEVCGRCPLMNQCAEYGLISNQTFGIWGGLTAQERELIRKK